MTDVSIHQVLAQMRSLRETMGQDTANSAQGQGGVSGPNFADLMGRALEQVNGNQQRAAAMSEAFERGEPGTDLAEVMIEMQKARVSFEAMIQVRNRLVEAYREIQNMPV